MQPVEIDDLKELSRTSQIDESDMRGCKRILDDDDDFGSVHKQRSHVDITEHRNFRPVPESCAKESDGANVSEESSDHNDVSSVAPSRSVCEQVETMMAGVKYCKERELGKEKKHGKDVKRDALEQKEPRDMCDFPPLESKHGEDRFTDLKEESAVVEGDDAFDLRQPQNLSGQKFRGGE
ncbi:unnamed protein product, partial [Strongylus vulgaris]